jgi:hypothetical protein
MEGSGAGDGFRASGGDPHCELTSGNNDAVMTELAAFTLSSLCALLLVSGGLLLGLLFVCAVDALAQAAGTVILLPRFKVPPSGPDATHADLPGSAPW